jgi:ATP synthase F1 delta subunit
VKITSSIKLSSAQQKAIAQKLKRSMRKTQQIKVALKVNPQLIGGFTIEFDSILIDISIRGQLRQISALLGA